MDPIMLPSLLEPLNSFDKSANFQFIVELSLFNHIFHLAYVIDGALTSLLSYPSRQSCNVMSVNIMLT